MIVGITGGIGSGKSFVANYFCEISNSAYYHADEEAKKLMNTSKELREKIVNSFGVDSYKNNELNREYLSELVFSNKENLQKLNSIVHPAVKKHFQQFVSTNSDKDFILYENAILFESKSSFVCDIILCVTAPEELRISRVMLRDSVSKESVLARINNQWTDNQRSIQSHYRITNIDIEKTKLQIKRIFNILTKRLS